MTLTAKEERLANMTTEALQRISDTARGAEVEEPSVEYPLGGLVHIEGIGQVSLRAIRAELERRATRDKEAQERAFKRLGY